MVNVKPDASFIRQKTGKIHIQVGIDFGTSSTKVVFSQLGHRFFRALDFNHDLPGYPNYCIPSLCSAGEKGNYLLGIKAARALSGDAWDSGIRRLKVVVAGEHDKRFCDPQTDDIFRNYLPNFRKNYSPRQLTAVFLAHVMAESTARIKKLPEYKGQQIDFAFNVCMPIDHLEHNEVKNAFQEVFGLSEILFNHWLKNKTLKINSKMIEESKTYKAQKVFAVPEAVASFASYLVSLQRERGLHAIIDFGAGTTDVSICNLFLSHGDPQCYWYAARNIPQGTIPIERCIAEHIKSKNQISACTMYDINSCLNEICSQTRNKGNLSKSDKQAISSLISEILVKFRDSKDYKSTWGSAYSYLKIDNQWFDVKIYTCGGGSYMPQVDEVFAKPWWRHLNTRYDVNKLPVPEDYDSGPAEAPFDRMSVAYGLAIPLPQLGGYTLPNESPNHTPAAVPMKSRDHEDMYSD